MKSFNVICGLPRSGSTLLCNILNQNTAVYASSTSTLCPALNSLSSIFSNSAELKASLIRDRKKTEARVAASMQGMIGGWYYDKDAHVFDKGRGWAANSVLLKGICPEALIVCLIRDLRNVFASIEKGHQNTPLFDQSVEPLQKTIYARADEMFSPGGVIGSSILGIEDLIRRQPANLIIIQYEKFVLNPESALKEIYSQLGVEVFSHDYNKIVNTAEDVDALYLNKFPHVGNGSIEQDSNEWRKYLSEDLAALILERFPFYNQIFGYSSAISKLNWNR